MVLSKELAHKDSNLEMTESESVALPFGDGPMCCLNKRYYTHFSRTSRIYIQLHLIKIKKELHKEVLETGPQGFEP